MIGIIGGVIGIALWLLACTDTVPAWSQGPSGGRDHSPKAPPHAPVPSPDPEPLPPSPNPLPEADDASFSNESLDSVFSDSETDWLAPAVG